MVVSLSFLVVECVTTDHTYGVWLVPLLLIDVDEVIGAHLEDSLLLVGTVREHVDLSTYKFLGLAIALFHL